MRRAYSNLLVAGYALIVLHGCLLVVMAALLFIQRPMAGPDWRLMSSPTRVALWIFDSFFLHVALSLGASILVYLAYRRCATWRPYWRMFFAACLLHAGLTLSLTLAAIHLDAQGLITFSSGSGVTQRRVLLSNFWEDLATQLFMAMPIAFFFLPWLPYLSKRFRHEMRQVRADLCDRCGYDLRGRSSASCPECGISRKRDQALPIVGR